jgi:uncharacterized protein (TIRG00374 family)
VKTTLRIGLSVGAALALLAALMLWTGVGPGQVLDALRGLPPRAFAAALACHVTVYFLRALRFRLLVPAGARPTFTRALAVSAAHNMASYILPAKTGEASFVVYLKRVCAVPASMGLASLVVARMLDGAVLCGALAVASLSLSLTGSQVGSEWVGTLGTVLLALTLVFALFSARGDWLVRVPARVLRALGLGKRPLGRRLLERAAQVAQAIRSAGSGGRLYLAAALTVPIWFGVFAFYAILGRALGLDVDFFEATFGASFAMISNLLPINGLAGAGTQEMGWVFGFGLLGVDEETAMSTGAAIHLVQLFNVVVMGFLGHLAMGMIRRDAPDPDAGAAAETGGKR